MLKQYGLALLTAFLLWLGQFENSFAFLLFLAFIPLLILEKSITEKMAKKAYKYWFWYCWLCFGTWNLLVTWRLITPHWSDLVMTIVVNSLLMTSVMIVFWWVKQKLGNQRGYIALPLLWISIESLWEKWDFSSSSSWPILGNGFTGNISWVQWYEYTGIFGGTLWIWIINLTLFGIFLHFRKKQNIKATLWRIIVAILLLVVLPVFFSQKKYQNHIKKGESEPFSIVLEQRKESGNDTHVTPNDVIKVNRELKMDNLIPRMSYFLGALIILYSLVQGILKKEENPV